MTGDIEGVEGHDILIAGSQGTRRLPFDAIQSAKLLLTDRLIAATQPLSTEGADEFLEAPAERADDLQPQEED